MLPFTRGREVQGRWFHPAENKEATSKNFTGITALDLAQNPSPCGDFCWMEVVHPKSLRISKPAEHCSVKKLKGYSEYDVVKEGTVGCTQTLSARFRLFHSNNTILYSGHMWLAYVYNESSTMHQTEAELFQSHCSIHYPDIPQLGRLMRGIS